LPPDVPRDMKNRADHSAIWLRRVKHEMRLEAETTISRAQFINDLADAGKVGQQAEGAIRPGKIGFGLVLAESRLREIIDRNQIRLCGG
jgi:hypothetical protein